MENIYTCPFCYREYKSKNAWCSHKGYCKCNPNYKPRSEKFLEAVKNYDHSKAQKKKKPLFASIAVRLGKQQKVVIAHILGPAYKILTGLLVTGPVESIRKKRSFRFQKQSKKMESILLGEIYPGEENILILRNG